ncbi:MAG: phosphatidylglycerol lysyltransferase domain-containing protein [Prevotellaceae bacterium]|nr:phosphatidylglycerol lysyltransferase domain-containing protein [Prevotellaceae bacterium]
MIPFKNITIDDKEIIQSFTLKQWRRNCELSFANLFSWSFMYGTQYAVVNDFLLMRFFYNNELVYMMPIGEGNLRHALIAIIDDAQSLQKPFRIEGACKNMCSELEEAMPKAFKYSVNRKYSDYIYLRENLVTLKGKKLQSKRNFINRFLKNNDNYEYKTLTPDLVGECIELEKSWYNENVNAEERDALLAERTALTLAINNMEALDLLGGVLFVNGKITAFTYGNPINYETFDICIEKADRNIEGSYAMINNLFAKHIPEQYIYINREEDLDIPGLRQAKLSYQPEMILEKHRVQLADNN